MQQNFKSCVLHMKKILCVLGLILAFTRCVYAADMNSAVGYWETRDDKTQQRTSIIKIWFDPRTQKYSGSVYKIFAVQGHKTTDLCTRCPGNLKNKPMLGLRIIRDMVYHDGKYIGGYVLDPQIGQEYHAQMRVVENGRVLKLRGYVGIPLFGRTAQWKRATSEKG